MIAAVVFSSVLLTAIPIAFHFLWSPGQSLSQAEKLKSSDPERALLLLSSVIRSPGRIADSAQLLRCRILVSRHRNSEARLAIQAIPDLKSCDPEELIRVGQACHSLGNNGIAEQLLDAAEEVVRASGQSLRTMLEVKYAMNRTVQVLELCQVLSALSPDDPMPWLIAAGIHHENEDRAPAIRAYQEALSRKIPADEANRVRYQLITLLMDVGDLVEARRQCDVLLAEPVTPAELTLIQLQNVDLLRREDRLQDAMKLVTEVLDRQPDLNLALQMRGYLNFESGETSKAIADLGIVVAQDPYNQSAHYKLGQAYLRQGQRAEAQEHLRRSQELIQLTSEILVTRNRLQNDPEDERLRDRLADLYELRGNSQMAARWRRSHSGNLK